MNVKLLVAIALAVAICLVGLAPAQAQYFSGAAVLQPACASGNVAIGNAAYAAVSQSFVVATPFVTPVFGNRAFFGSRFGFVGSRVGFFGSRFGFAGNRIGSRFGSRVGHRR